MPDKPAVDADSERHSAAKRRKQSRRTTVIRHLSIPIWQPGDAGDTGALSQPLPGSGVTLGQDGATDVGQVASNKASRTNTSTPNASTTPVSF